MRDFSLKPGCDFKSDNVVEIKGIASGVVKSKGTAHEATHDFHVKGIIFICNTTAF
jgi:hypothetical protein